MSKIENHLIDLDNGVSFIETEQGTMKTQLMNIEQTYVNKTELAEIKKELIDISNRNRRNNFVLYNIPSKTENGDCKKYVQKFVEKELGLSDIEIETAHRTKIPGNTDNIEPIHARCLRRDDRNKILQAAIKKIKDVIVGGNKISIGDDIHPVTREEHKKLVEIMKNMRKENKFAYIPFSIPRVIKYKDTPKGQPRPLKTFQLPSPIY